VPLYVEELTKAVAEPGAARGADAIPSTLAGSLMARLDRLSTAKEVAQRAAVLGREFAYPLLAAVADLEDAALRQGLARLVEGEILFVRGEPPEATYTFKHALVQEAAYESLLRRTRQELHGRVFDALAVGPTAAPELLARHAEAAAHLDEAIVHYQRAGEQAEARTAHAEAIRHLERAIALLARLPEGGPRDAREIALQLALTDSVATARGYAQPEVGQAAERARILSESAGDLRALGLALHCLATFAAQLRRLGASRGLRHARARDRRADRRPDSPGERARRSCQHRQLPGAVQLLARPCRGRRRPGRDCSPPTRGSNARW
jgi:predicted ATPase